MQIRCRNPICQWHRYNPTTRLIDRRNPNYVGTAYVVILAPPDARVLSAQGNLNEDRDSVNEYTLSTDFFCVRGSLGEITLCRNCYVVVTLLSDIGYQFIGDNKSSKSPG